MRLLSATVVRRVPLYYAEGADARMDRPAHVRAGSGLAWFEDRVCIAQDDANWLALCDLDGRDVQAVPLASIHGQRLFGDDRGNKGSKLDLEALCALPDGRLLATGSGSSAARTRWMLFDGSECKLCEMAALYAKLAELPSFATAELNLEGAAVAGDDLLLGQRSNGTAFGALPRADAIARVSLRQALAAAENGGPPPEPQMLCQFNLGSLGGVRLTLTDLCFAHDLLWFAAAAEDSPDARSDGAVAGSGIGLFGADGPRWVPVCDQAGPLAVKIEGLALDPRNPRQCFAVIDADDLAAPCELLHIELAFGQEDP